MFSCFAVFSCWASRKTPGRQVMTVRMSALWAAPRQKPYVPSLWELKGESVDRSGTRGRRAAKPRRSETRAATVVLRVGCPSLKLSDLLRVLSPSFIFSQCAQLRLWTRAPPPPPLGFSSGFLLWDINIKPPGQPVNRRWLRFRNCWNAFKLAAGEPKLCVEMAVLNFTAVNLDLVWSGDGRGNSFPLWYEHHHWCGHKASSTQETRKQVGETSCCFVFLH